MPLIRRLRTLNRTLVAGNPSHTRVVAVYMHANRLEFFTMTGERYRISHGPRPTTPNYTFDDQRLRFSDDHQFAYVSVTATDARVFALFHGGKRAERKQPTRVHVFDWDGVFQRELELGRGVYRISVSADGRSLYGAVREPVPLVVEFAVTID